MNQHIKNIYHLGIKEVIELMQDYCMLILIFFAFTAQIYVTALGTPDSVQNAPIAVVDEDNSQLSKRLIDSFLPPIFQKVDVIPLSDDSHTMDTGKYTFSLIIPSNFQRDALAGKSADLQLNVDATRMTQAFVGAGYIQQIIKTEAVKFISEDPEKDQMLARLDLRNKFNPNLIASWFGGTNQLVNVISMLAIVLIGAALIRERERGTLEHLLVMPVTPAEIMCAKIWSMMLIVAVASILSVFGVLKGMLDMPIDGSLLLYAFGVGVHLFAITSMGIFLACIAQNMPQMGMLLLLVLMPMNMLSGGQTPRESMPVWVQNVMELAPTTHFVMFSQQILFRGAGWDVVWLPFLKLFLIGLVLFILSLRKFHKSVTS